MRPTRRLKPTGQKIKRSAKSTQKTWRCFFWEISQPSAESAVLGASICVLACMCVCVSMENRVIKKLEGGRERSPPHFGKQRGTREVVQQGCDVQTLPRQQDQLKSGRPKKNAFHLAPCSKTTARWINQSIKPSQLGTAGTAMALIAKPSTNLSA